MSTEELDAVCENFANVVGARVANGARFCGLFAVPQDQATRLVSICAHDGVLERDEHLVESEASTFASLTSSVPAAAWYEREIQDLYGVVPLGHPRANPLVLPRSSTSVPPRPGSDVPAASVELDTTPLPAHLSGEGVFTIPYGPVRSGVFESIEYLVETPGEDIPHLRTRVFYKHRGIEARFCGMSVGEGALMAERAEGVASVAHAIAYAEAVERIAGVEIPDAAALVRVIHAELERVANHLDSTIHHTEGAGQAVAYARLTLHKERLQRLRSRLCGSRFGRGVVIPGGVRGALGLSRGDLFDTIDQIEHGINSDLRMLLATPSFVDRLRATGVVAPAVAERFAAIGPVGRASGQGEDVRFARPYAAYGRLGHQLLEPKESGDALARQRVRIEEIAGAFHLIRQAIDRIERVDTSSWCNDVGTPSGEDVGWAEAPQGEVLYLVTIEDGILVRVKPRSASFHNLGLFHAAFPKDILTDFAFIEASFGLSIAGVAS